MNATVEIGQEVKVRLSSYTSFRHYGGREITEKVHTCKAKLIRLQSGHQPYIVELIEKCCNYRIGHLIAVTEQDFNI